SRALHITDLLTTRTMARIPIPPRYFAKLLVELLLLGGAVILYSIGHDWFDTMPRVEGTLDVILRFLIFLFGASIVVRLLAMIYRGRKHLPYHKKDNVTIGLSNLFMLIISVYGIISVFGLFGVGVTTMFTTVS